MTGSDCIDIVLFHGDDILQHLLIVRNPSKPSAKLMPVDTLKHNPLPIELHDAIVQCKVPEPDLLRDDFHNISVRIIQCNQQLIQIRRLCTPEHRRVNCHVHRRIIAVFQHNF